MALNKLLPWKKENKNLPARQQQDPFMALQHEMNRLFSDFSTGFGMEPWSEEMTHGWVPSVNVAETDKDVTITAELPGMEEQDIDVSLTNDVLTLKGEKKSESEDKGKNFYRSERHYGAFHREVQLPAEVESDKAEAKFKNGVLAITLPKSKTAQQQVKKIAVKS